LKKKTKLKKEREKKFFRWFGKKKTKKERGKKMKIFKKRKRKRWFEREKRKFEKERTESKRLVQVKNRKLKKGNQKNQIGSKEKEKILKISLKKKLKKINSNVMILLEINKFKINHISYILHFIILTPQTLYIVQKICVLIGHVDVHHSPLSCQFIVPTIIIFFLSFFIAKINPSIHTHVSISAFTVDPYKSLK
jgi:hypothetical protein